MNTPEESWERGQLAILLDMWDDGKLPHEHRTYVEGAFGETFEHVRRLFAERQPTPTAGQAQPSPEVSTQALPWRCFHCEEVFTDQESAALHFGTSERQDPACKIDVAEYRAMEERMVRYNEEDSDLHRAIHAAESKGANDARRAEETGYARGLADAKKHPEELGLMAVSTQAVVTDAEIIEAFAEQDLFLIHHQPGEDDRIPDCGIFSDVTVADVKKALAYLAARTPSTALPVPGDAADDFKGDDAALCRSIDALLSLDAAGALVPHGIGGHARGLLSAASARLSGATK